ncbi:MAG: endonuclease/exonuclease/phosphatase family protein [Flavobacteriales bacterium]|nr:endonuclease/exonuclease/phosphatase family protein [Flavobacteriales bacterium]
MKNLSFLNKLIYIFNLILLVLWGIAFMAPYLNPKSFTIPAILAIAYPLILGLHVLFVIYWLMRFNRKILLSVSAIALSYFFSIPIFQPKSSFKALAKDNSFSILSFNSQLAYFSGGKKEEVEGHQSKIAHFIKQENADVICLQEVRKGMSSNLNYPHTRTFGFSQIHSKYEIITSEKIEFNENSTNNSCFADFRIHEDTVRVYNLHLESLHLGNEDYNLLKKRSDSEVENEFQDNTKKLKQKIGLATSKRVNQIEKILNSIADSPYPTLICGDFNDVPQSYIYRKLIENHKDAFIESGKGYGATYRQLIFPFRIDYILPHKHWNAYNFEVLEDKLSDHQAIRCDIEFNQ